jgi:hypothetical protein
MRLDEETDGFYYLIRMLPPRKVRYYFSINGKKIVAKDQLVEEINPAPAFRKRFARRRW